jgi:transcriptional regulator with XRE-family HTH domain
VVFVTEPAEIGLRVRTIRRRRGLSLDTAAGLAGISKPYLSMLERGERRFERRGLLEDLANALGCAVIDLTGEPYLPGDRAGAEAMATLPPISVALFDATLADVPDVPARPIEELTSLAQAANAASAESRYSLAGRDLGALLTELHVHAVTGDSDTQRAALAALTEACFVAAGNARNLGNHDLSVHAARRGEDAARRLGDPALTAFAAMTSTSSLSRMGARHRAQQVATAGLAAIEPHADPASALPAAAEAAGMLHLSSAQMAAKDHNGDRARDHLREAADLAERTGERNELQFSFGPANVRAWSMSIAVELGEGADLAERITGTDGFDAHLVTADRRAALHFDLARGFAQAEGARDVESVRHLDIADRIAPQRIRHDPVAREVVAQLGARARRRAWELDSLKHRLGVG